MIKISQLITICVTHCFKFSIIANMGVFFIQSHVFLCNGTYLYASHVFSCLFQLSSPGDLSSLPTIQLSGYSEAGDHSTRQNRTDVV